MSHSPVPVLLIVTGVAFLFRHGSRRSRWVRLVWNLLVGLLYLVVFAVFMFAPRKPGPRGQPSRPRKIPAAVLSGPKRFRGGSR